MKKLTSLLVAVLAALFLVSCVSVNGIPDKIPQLRAGDIGSGQLVLVGSVRFTPEIVYEKHFDPKAVKPGETETVLANDPLIFFTVNKNAAILNDSDNSKGNYIQQGATFMVKTELAANEYLKGFGLAINKEYFSGGLGGIDFAAYYTGRFKITVPAKAKAIYLGTFEIKRNDFYEPTGYSMIDDYDKANAEFLTRFPGWELVRADIVNVDAKK